MGEWQKMMPLDASNSINHLFVMVWIMLVKVWIWDGMNCACELYEIKMVWIVTGWVWNMVWIVTVEADGMNCRGWVYELCTVWIVTRPHFA